jgi:hypothetical protein
MKAAQFQRLLVQLDELTSEQRMALGKGDAAKIDLAAFVNQRMKSLGTHKRTPPGIRLAGGRRKRLPASLVYCVVAECFRSCPLGGAGAHR